MRIMPLATPSVSTSTDFESYQNVCSSQQPGFSPDDIQALFNRIAPVYDRLNDQLSFGLHRIWKRMTVKWAGPTGGNIALDLCCGSGDLAFLLAEQVGPEGKVYGVDFAQAQLTIAAQRSKHLWPRPSIVWQPGNALDLQEFTDNIFDAATMGYGLRNVGNILQCLRELHRVLKPGAKAALLDMHRPKQIWLQQLQHWYLANQVVPTAQDLGMTAEYAYISPSLERFAIGGEQVKLSLQAGFTKAKHYPVAMGMMGVLVLQK